MAGFVKGDVVVVPFPYIEAELNQLRRSSPAWHRTLVSGWAL